jgi:SH3 domain-containing YSC84-like protein 1
MMASLGQSTRLTRASVALSAVALTISSSLPVWAQSSDRTVQRAENALQAFQGIMSDADKRVPAFVLRQSVAVAIIPKVIQGGLFFGGRRGTGVMLVRRVDGSWSNPAFVNLTGGSFGLQVGARSSDVVLVMRDPQLVNQVSQGKLKISGSISGTAGPVGASAAEPTEGGPGPKIYSYARSEGLFGGVAIAGAELGINKGNNRDFYGSQVSPSDIFNGSLQTPPIAERLKQSLQTASGQ